MVALIKAVDESVYSESPTATPATAAALRGLIRAFDGQPRGEHKRIIGRMFPQVQRLAEQAGAPNTAREVTRAASWFYSQAAPVSYGPPAFQPSPASEGAPSTSKGGAPSTPRDRRDRRRPLILRSRPKQPITKQVWFWPAVVGGVGILVATGILLVGRR
jgi:hypothetical protein